jgi:hypothetical protein
VEIKVLCPCGTKFAFEVEPVDGQMPEAAACPACGADSTAAANAVIRQALAGGTAPTPVAKAAPVRIGAPPLPSAVSAGPPPAAAVAEAEPAITRCPKHPQEIAVAECAVCGKPICQVCLDQFGFLCSVYCKQQAEQRNLVVPSFTGRKTRERARERRQQSYLLYGIGLALVAVLGGWAWYAFYASQPRLAFRLEASKSQPFLHAQWVHDRQLLAASSTKITLHSPGGHETWSTILKPDERLATPGAGAVIRVTGDTFWAVQTGHAVQYDLTTGQRKRDVAIPTGISTVLWSEGALMVEASPARGAATLTRVDLGSGQTQTETVPAAASSPVVAVAPARALDDDDSNRSVPLFFSERSEFTASGGGAVRLTSRLLQANLVEAGAPNRPDAFSALDKETLRAGDSMPAAMAFVRGNARLRVHDFGLYAVTLRRYFAGAAEWTGNVIGKPAFFSLATVDVLVSGTNVSAFSRSGQKLWDARLNYPASPDILRDGDTFPEGPCREIGSRLYVFDLGVLTALDLKTGRVHWRLPAVGIEQVEADATGALYVAATTAGPDAIALDENLAANPSVQPLLLKVEAASGKILWQRDRVAQRTFPSGKFLYVTRRQLPGRDLVSLATGDNTIHFRVRRLKPGNGEELWAYYQPRPPKRLEVSGRRFLLQYPDEIQIVKFFSF